MSAPERLTIALNLKRSAAVQWTNFNFNSMCVFEGSLIGANEDGLFTLLDADDDNGTDIDSFFELPTSDLGMPETKKVRFSYVSGETSGNLKLKYQVDEDEERTFMIPARKTGQLQHRMHRIDGRNDLRGVFWRTRIENIKGCDFSIDSLDVLMMFLGSR